MLQILPRLIEWYRHRRSDRGASIVEYGALVVIIGVIAGAVAATDIGGEISTHITTAVSQVFTNNDIGSGAE